MESPPRRIWRRCSISGKGRRLKSGRERRRNSNWKRRSRAAARQDGCGDSKEGTLYAAASGTVLTRHHRQGGVDRGRKSVITPSRVTVHPRRSPAEGVLALFGRQPGAYLASGQARAPFSPASFRSSPFRVRRAELGNPEPRPQDVFRSASLLWQRRSSPARRFVVEAIKT
jgi:hypothetical protein